MKIAVLGLGSIGRRHLGNFRSVGVETLTAYDQAPAQREAAAKDFPFASIAATAEAARRPSRTSRSAGWPPSAALTSWSKSLSPSPWKASRTS
jgi:threonine dehydrogenase-like Zn-dependent dehydrogenase